MKKIKKGDKVKIITGSDKGKVGEVLKVLVKDQKVVVTGVNLKTVFNKKSVNAGKRIEFPVHVSNVSLVDSEGNSGRVGFKIDESGNKTRFVKKVI